MALRQILSDLASDDLKSIRNKTLEPRKMIDPVYDG